MTHNQIEEKDFNFNRKIEFISYRIIRLNLHSNSVHKHMYTHNIKHLRKRNKKT